jgi:RNA polymerase sigma-70 factor (ECF subfamily)
MSDQTSQLELHRHELTGYCYRMLGSAFDAEDAVQETMVRAWKNLAGFEGRSSLRSWLYRIAHNVCMDVLGSAQRRVRPVDLGGSYTANSALEAPLAESAWLGPIPDSLTAATDPAEQAVAKDSLRLAFVAALQHLPPKQRAILVLREVLNWPAADVAELLQTSVASVNSGLQRARASIASAHLRDTDSFRPLDEEQQELLRRYVTAFESYDMDSLTALLHEDATLSMPPVALWLRGPEQIRAWFLGTGQGCRGSRLLPVVANGSPGFGQYRPTGRLGRWEPWALQVLEITDGQVIGLNSFLDAAELFPMFGLPPHLAE